MRVRPGTEADAEAVAALWTEAYVTLGVGGRSRPYAVADFEDSAGQGEVFVIDACAGERAGVGTPLAGVVALLPPTAPRRAVALDGEAELSRLAVASSARRRGIGRALAEHCTQRARAAGWPAIALWSRPLQSPAHRLYESLGYRRLPDRDSVDATGLARLVFRLDLPGGARPGQACQRSGP